MADENNNDVDRSEIASQGGKARSESLTPARRREIAREGAAKRWSTDLPKAESDGELMIAGRRIACAVLNTKMRVLTQETFLTAVGRAAKAKGGKGSERLAMVDGLPPFLAARNLERFIDDSLRRAATPVVFRTRTGGTAYGYDALLLPLVCEVYQKARDAHMVALSRYQKSQSTGLNVDFKGVLLPTQEHIVHRCDELMRGLAKDGIIAMVDRATGYVDPEMRDEITRIVKMYVPGGLIPWDERFPEEFFRQIYRLYGWVFKPGSAKRPQWIGQFIIRYVYGQLPQGVYEKLREDTPVLESGHRQTQLHRRLSKSMGVPHLERQVASTTTVLALTETGAGTKAFEELFYRIYPRPLPAPRKIKTLTQKINEAGSTLFPSSLFPTIDVESTTTREVD